MKRKQEILREVAGLFFEKGYSGTSVRDIGKALNITNPGIYYYFENKQQILYTICNDLMTRVLEDVRARISTMTAPREMLEFMVKAHIDVFVESPAETKVMIYEQHSLEGEYRSRFRRQQREYMSVLKEVLGRLAEESGADVDLNVAAFSLIGMLNWVVQWYEPAGKVPPDRLAEDVARLFLKGFEGSHD
ncbi:MAG: TetR/AcrR family transcriptional regulator [Deltaproteobacteria bacterium]|nr:TetR/AcrR family transcriptional regulator [Deltaproteobacteria bacterium]